MTPGPITPGPITPGPAAPRAEDSEDGPRPLIERIGLGANALVVAVHIGAMSLASLAGGEVFLGVMAGIGALMTVWAAGSTLRG